MSRQSGFAARVHAHAQNLIAQQCFVATVHAVSGGGVAIIRPKQTQPDRDTAGSVVFYQAAAGVSYAPGDRVLVNDVGGAVLIGHRYE